MKELFRDLLALNNVFGAMFLAEDGRVLFKQFIRPPSKDLNSVNWTPFIQSVTLIKEADLLYENCRIYIRKTYGGYIVVHLNTEAQPSLVRMHCDLIMPRLKSLQEKGMKGAKIGRFFKK